MVSLNFLLCAAISIAASAQSLTTLVNFNNHEKPDSTFIRGKDGNIYGTTSGGGTHGGGTVFKRTAAGQVVTVYNFCSQEGCIDGGAPNGLVQGTDGNFYGTTRSGGVFAQWGTVFKLTPTGVLTTLHRFQFADGAVPRATLVQGDDGSFYGTTYQGGTNVDCFGGVARACGTVFKVSSAGVFTTLYAFCSQTNCTDGANPVGRLIRGNDGNFYGTTAGGGAGRGADDCTGGCGTVFKVTPGGNLISLHSFCSLSGCADGQFPNAGLVLGKDGNLYGTTYEGGAAGGGTIFKITFDGQLETVYSFSRSGGFLPNAELLLGRDNNFYGTAFFGGAHDAGAIFKLSPGGVFTTLYSFCSRGVSPWCTDGEFPYAGLVQGKDGRFYGSTVERSLTECGANCGTIFSFGVGLDLLPSSGPVGKKITIVGLNLLGATSVRFHGLTAPFTLVSATKITAIVPDGATTGPVKVVTPGGVLTSNLPFTVTPRIKSFKPLSGPVGTAVIISGISLAQTTQVTFGGVSADNSTVNSDTQVTALVPSGAQTGNIGITTSSGTTLSVGIFTVTP
jgi:uncharacterized repeat protein (TIGR03803 family)